MLFKVATILCATLALFPIPLTIKRPLHSNTALVAFAKSEFNKGIKSYKLSASILSVCCADSNISLSVSNC